MDNPFWEYSLAVYSYGEVAEHCLALQDKQGMDVNLLLYAAWLGHLEQRLDEHHLRDLDAVVAPWRKDVVKPLRAIRRRLSGDLEAEEFREEIKGLELRAERRQQDRMYEFYQRAPRLPAQPGSRLENLSLVAQYSCGEEGGWDAAIAHLGRVFPR